MKLKILFLVLALAMVSVAQTAAPAPDAKTCACCNHDQAATSAKAGCCKDGKCPLMSNEKAGMKCPMMAKAANPADGKMCCASNKCPMHDQGAKANGCCCGNMDEQKPAGM